VGDLITNDVTSSRAKKAAVDDLAGELGSQRCWWAFGSTSCDKCKGRRKAAPSVLSKAKLDESTNPVTFADVAGCDERKRKSKEVVTSEEYPISKSWVDVFRVVVADGPPGTGKTLLAKSIAGEARCAFFSISVPTCRNVWCRRFPAFATCLTFQEKRACIIFIDEIDAVGRQRGAVWVVVTTA
jgi:cell division protease FtsH